MKGLTILTFALVIVIALMGTLLILDRSPAPLVTDLTAAEAEIMGLETPAMLAIDGSIALSIDELTSQSVATTATSKVATQTLYLIGGTVLAICLLIVTVLYVVRHFRPGGWTLRDYVRCWPSHPGWCRSHRGDIEVESESYPDRLGPRSPRDCIAQPTAQ